jgi:hypothetical protein
MLIARFTDCDDDNDIDSKKSISGYLFILGNSTISYQLPKQRFLSTSMTKVKYIALSKAVKYFL